MNNTNQGTMEPMEEQWDFPIDMNNTNQDTMEEQWDFPIDMNNINQGTMEEQWDFPIDMNNINQGTMEAQGDFPIDMDNTNQGSKEAWHIVIIVLGFIASMLFLGLIIYLRCKRLKQRQLLLLSISSGDHVRPNNIDPSDPATVSPCAQGNANGPNAHPQPSLVSGPRAYTPNAPPRACAPDNCDRKTLVNDDKLQNNYSQGYY